MTSSVTILSCQKAATATVRWGGVSVEGDSAYLHRVDDRKPVDEAEAARTRDVEIAKAEKRAVEFEAWRRRILDADEEVRNLTGGLTLDPL